MTTLRCLRDKSFGSLQNSVWIKPDPLTEQRQILGGGKIHVEVLRDASRQLRTFKPE